MRTCDVCQKSFGNKNLLRHHRRNVHKIPAYLFPMECNVCHRMELSVALIDQHFREKHGTQLDKMCVYCGVGFDIPEHFYKHLEEKHELPPPAESTKEKTNPISSAFDGALKVYKIEGSGENDLMQFMTDIKPQIDQLVSENVNRTARKLQLILKVELSKPTKDEETQVFLRSNMVPVYGTSLPQDDFLSAVDQLLNTLFTFTASGSGWILEKIVDLDVKFATFSPIRGSSYLPTPPELDASHLLLNIRNRQDHNCFLYCFTAAWHLKHGPLLYVAGRDSLAKRTSPDTYSRRNPLAHQAEGEFEMPMGFGQMLRFEKLNDCKINVFRYTENQLVPLRVTREKGDGLEIDLLLVDDGQEYHYILILDLLRLVSMVKGTTTLYQRVLCKNCFHICMNENTYRRHQISCLQHEPAVVKMPTPEKNKLKFANLGARWFAPVVIYFDLESIIKPVAGCQNAKQQRSITEIHQPSGFCLIGIEHGNPNPVFMQLERSENCMEKFVGALEKIAQEMYQKKQSNRYFRDSVPERPQEAQLCWICEGQFGIVRDIEDDKVIDHCHYSGKFLEFAHPECNLKRKTVNFIPVMAHNLSNYDLHHVCLYIHKFKPGCKVDVIPNTDEKYITLTIGVPVRSYLDKNGVTKTVFEYLRFIDSFRFMASSLEKLASYLPKDKFKILDSCFADYSESDRDLLHQKGYYPYSYFDSFDKFQEEELPPRYQWTDSLRNKAIMLTQDEWEHAKKVYERFACANLGDYHDLYLKTDTLILACVVEEFRSLCYTTYGLDSAHYFTCSHLSGDTFLKKCRADIELLTDREHLEMVENMIRGGVASVFDKRFFKANNRYVAEHNYNDYNTYGVLLDANNLYGGVMEKLPSPLNSFETVQNIDLNKILETTNDSEEGYILEVDLHYPDKLHDGHQDFPLAPTKERIYYKSLGEKQQELLEIMGETRPYSQGTKLIQSLSNKSIYTVHYITLKLYVSLGMEVKKVHRVLKFKQTKWLKPYMELNTAKRKESRNKFEESFFKLMNNSCYGKTLESKRNRLTVQLISNRESLLRRTDTPFFCEFKIFNENLAAISSRKRSILWNKPTIVGASVLDLAKFHMFNFHYNVMKKHLNCFVLYSDTDSLLYEIKYTDFYEELATNDELRQHFDLSNYPKEHHLYNADNKMVTLKFKDELGGEPIEEFVGLKPKMYSIMVGGRQKLSAKGVCRFAQKELNHELYKKVLKTGESYKTVNMRIGSQKHQLQTIKTNKVSLSSFDDKRYVLEDGISTLPHGHYMIRDVHVEQDIVDEPEWGYEEEEIPSSPTWDELNGNDPQVTISQIFPDEAPMLANAPLSSPLRVRVSDDGPVSLTQQLMEAWSPPDPGMHQREYSDSELEDQFSNMDESVEERSPPRNPFIDDEAVEASDTGETANEDDEESDPNDCVIVETLTEDAIEDLEYLIDFDNWFSDDEFVNRIKRAKRRRMEIVSDSE